MKRLLISAIRIPQSALLLFLATPLHAFPNYALMYKSAFTYLPSCLACHDKDSWDPNKFGKQFGKNGRSRKTFEAVAGLDADGDGIANSIEIQARSNPGDPRSTPKSPGDWLKETGIRPPKKILRVAFPGASDFKVREVIMDEKQAGELSTAWGEPIPDESRYCAIFDASDNAAKAGSGTYLSVDLPGADGPSLLFIASAKPGILSFLKFVEYDGTKKLAKEKVWKGLLGKSRADLLKDTSVKGPEKEIQAFKQALVRGLLVLETTWDK